jgi:hypothetical protein
MQITRIERSTLNNHGWQMWFYWFGDVKYRYLTSKEGYHDSSKTVVSVIECPYPDMNKWEEPVIIDEFLPLNKANPACGIKRFYKMVSSQEAKTVSP